MTAQSKGSPKAAWLIGVAIVAAILIYIGWGSMSVVSRELASARAAYGQALHRYRSPIVDAPLLTGSLDKFS